MTREEKIELLEFLRQGLIINARVKSDYDIVEALGTAISALKGPTREQVEKMRGEWIDFDGEKVPVDKYGQPFGWAKCSACGEYLTASDEYPCIGNFCPACGAPMTDKAVDMVMERLETLYEET